MDSELCFAPATELRQLIDAREVSIVELAELFYRRIQELNPQLSAYLALCPDQAFAAELGVDLFPIGDDPSLGYQPPNIFASYRISDDSHHCQFSSPLHL